MSLYREPGRLRRRRRALVAGGVLLLAAVGVLVWLVAGGGDGERTRADRAAAVRAAAAKAGAGLDLLVTEYAQGVRNGQVTAPTEYQAAKADVARALDAIRERAGDLDLLAPANGATADRALVAVAGAVAARKDRADLAELIRRARQALAPLLSLR
jgi:hypothetical protein